MIVGNKGSEMGGLEPGFVEADRVYIPHLYSGHSILVDNERVVRVQAQVPVTEFLGSGRAGSGKSGSSGVSGSRPAWSVKERPKACPRSLSWFMSRDETSSWLCVCKSVLEACRDAVESEDFRRTCSRASSKLVGSCGGLRTCTWT